MLPQCRQRSPGVAPLCRGQFGGVLRQPLPQRGGVLSRLRFHLAHGFLRQFPGSASGSRRRRLGTPDDASALAPALLTLAGAALSRVGFPGVAGGVADGHFVPEVDGGDALPDKQGALLRLVPPARCVLVVVIRIARGTLEDVIPLRVDATAAGVDVAGTQHQLVRIASRGQAPVDFFRRGGAGFRAAEGLGVVEVFGAILGVRFPLLVLLRLGLGDLPIHLVPQLQVAVGNLGPLLVEGVARFHEAGFGLVGFLVAPLHAVAHQVVEGVRHLLGGLVQFAVERPRGLGVLLEGCIGKGLLPLGDGATGVLDEVLGRPLPAVLDLVQQVPRLSHLLVVLLLSRLAFRVPLQMAHAVDEVLGWFARGLRLVFRLPANGRAGRSRGPLAALVAGFVADIPGVEHSGAGVLVGVRFLARFPQPGFLVDVDTPPGPVQFGISRVDTVLIGQAAGGDQVVEQGAIPRRQFTAAATVAG